MGGRERGGVNHRSTIIKSDRERMMEYIMSGGKDMRGMQGCSVVNNPRVRNVERESGSKELPRAEEDLIIKLVGKTGSGERQ